MRTVLNGTKVFEGADTMKYFKELIVSVTLILFVVITVGAISNLSHISYGDERNQALEFSIAIILGVFFLLFIILSYKIIDHIQLKKQKYVSLLLWGIFFAISIFFILSIDYRPNTDSLIDMDTGWYLNSHAFTENNRHIYWMKIYGNNYLLVFIFKWLAKIAGLLKITNKIRYLLVFNLLCISLGIFLTWKIVILEKGIKRANDVLLLVVANPLLYYLIFWVYSSSMSIPVMMGIFYLLVLLHRGVNSRWKKIISGILLGILTAFGWFIRPTAIFPLVAYVVYILICDLKRCRKKSFWLVLAFVIISGVFSFRLINYEINDTFAGQRESNLPVFRWTYLASYGNGDLSTYNDATASQIQEDVKSGQTLSEAYRTETLNNYKKMGISGTINLWHRKTLTTYSDAFSAVVSRAYCGTYSGTIFEILKGPIGKTYAYIYRIGLYLGIIIGLFLLQKENSMDVGFIMSVLILFGGLLFNFLWECKGDYALVYMPVMGIVSAEGFYSASSRVKDCKFFYTHTNFLMVLLLMVFISANEWTILAEDTVTNNNRIDGNNRHRGNDHVQLKLGDNDELVQSFFCKKKFNKIVIQAETYKSDSNSNDNSMYEISLYGEGQEPEYTTVVSAENLSDDDTITLETGNIYDNSGRFKITIKRTSSGNGNLMFFTGNNYYFDSYDGVLSLNSKEYDDDLSMEVLYSENGPIMVPGWRLAFIVTIDLIMLVIWIVLPGTVPGILKGRNCYGN